MNVLASDIWLDSCLAPLAAFLGRADVTDIFVNRPGEVWIEQLGGTIERHDAPQLSATVLARLARQIAALNAQGVNREHPLLAGSLPDGSRVQIVLPPATRGHIALAIRRHVVAGMSLGDYTRAGSFQMAALGDGARPVDRPSLIEQADTPEVQLRQAVRAKKNILVSGGTSTGKTTFLNALLAEIPGDERLITIEDTAELDLKHENVVGLLAARGVQGEALVSSDDLLVASLRMRPDRIILGEMRGSEAFTFLRAVNTGHPGSMSSIHADSPERALDQLALLVLQGGTRMGWEEIMRYVRSSLDLIIQLKRERGRRIVDRILLLDCSGDRQDA